MKTLRLGGLLVAMLLLTGSFLSGQDAPKSRGQLPQNWSKLGLSEEQKTKIYAIQANYKAKVEKLQKEIADLKEKETKERVAVLTEQQKTRLRELATGEGGDKKDK